MSNEYRLILIDEFDWGYSNTSKAEVIDKIQEAGFTIEASIPYMIVVYCGLIYAKDLVEHLGIPFDSAYEQVNNGAILERIGVK